MTPEAVISELQELVGRIKELAAAMNNAPTEVQELMAGDDTNEALKTAQMAKTILIFSNYFGVTWSLR